MNASVVIGQVSNEPSGGNCEREQASSEVWVGSARGIAAAHTAKLLSGNKAGPKATAIEPRAAAGPLRGKRGLEISFREPRTFPVAAAYLDRAVQRNPITISWPAFRRALSFVARSQQVSVGRRRASRRCCSLLQPRLLQPR